MTCGDVCGLRVEQLLLSTTASSHSRARSQCHNDVRALVTASCGYYALRPSLYYKRFAARKGGATLDATERSVRVSETPIVIPPSFHPFSTFSSVPIPGIVRR